MRNLRYLAQFSKSMSGMWCIHMYDHAHTHKRLYNYSKTTALSRVCTYFLSDVLPLIGKFVHMCMCGIIFMAEWSHTLNSLWRQNLHACLESILDFSLLWIFACRRGFNVNLEVLHTTRRTSRILWISITRKTFVWLTRLTKTNWKKIPFCNFDVQYLSPAGLLCTCTYMCVCVSYVQMDAQYPSIRKCT